MSIRRKATLIAKYGTLDEYNRYWQEKRRDTLIAKLGAEGYAQYLKDAGSTGGTRSKRGKAKRRRQPLD
jgi:hypothetical protein